MDRLDEITLGDIGRTLGRYRPFIAVLTGILLVAVFIPGEQPNTPGGNAASTLTNPTGGTDQGSTGSFGAQNPAAAGGSQVDASAGNATTNGGGGSADGGTSQGGDPQGGDPQGGGPQSGAAGGGDAGGGDVGASGGMNPTCDPNAGHLAIPSLVAPPCVPVAPNTGGDYQGVTGDTIKIAYYQVSGDETSQALLTAAGAEDTDEEEQSTVRDWIDYYTHHYEQYGRDIEVVFVQQSGSSESAMIADARRVANEIEAFASINSPSNVYTEELAAHGVMCLACQVSQPAENYQAIRPHSWGTLMASTQGYIHRAEYVGKRLWQAGKKAEFAGDATMQLEDRTFGLIYYNNNGAYETGAEFFEGHLHDRWGIDLAIRRDYVGYPDDTAASQQAARPLIQAMIDAGVTSVLCACDPFAPVFFTQEATNQQYFPEWIITGSALTDTTLFARLYDQQQWENAFGISFLTARMPEELSDSLRQLKWHFGQDYEPASSQYGTIRSGLHLFFLGTHLAGPTLTPETFEQGMFSMPPLGRGHIIEETTSYGTQVWNLGDGLNDYTSYDDITALWWDRTATGESEVGTQGVGMYRYVDMGKRYLPGEQPEGPPKAFQPENTVTVYDDYPEGDRPPEYEHQD